MTTRGLLRGERGSVAVEFAILAPVMATLLFGSFTTMHLVRASMALWNVAQGLGDLTAQQSTVTSAGMSDFCTGASLTLVPFTGALTATVASVTQSASGTTAVDWQDTSCGSGSTIANALALGTPYVPNPQDSVIIVKAIYVYTFPPSYILPSSITLTRTTFSRPRNGTQVTHG